MAFFTKDRDFYKTFFRLTLTIAAQNLIVYAVNLADNIMIGAYDQTALSGIALVNQIQFLLQMLVLGVGDGIVVIASRYWGQRDLASIKKTSSVGMILGVGMSLLLWGLMFFLPEQILGLLASDRAVIASGAEYARIVCFSYLFFALTNLLLAILRSVETVRIGVGISIMALVVNITLNRLLIFGIGPFPELGARGAAIATLVSRIAETVVVVLYLCLRDRVLHLRLRDFLHTERAFWGQFFRVGFSVVLSGGSWGMAMLIQSGILGHLGEEVIAANSIASTVFSIVTVVVYGSASASAVVIGKALGEGLRDRMREYSRTLQMIYLGIGLATGLILFLIREPILSFYRITPLTAEYAISFLTILSVTVVGTAYQMTVLSGIVRGGGDTRFVFYNDLVHMWGIVLPLSLIAANVLHAAPAVVFLCLKADQILKCGIAAVYVNSYRWIKKI